MLRCQFLPATNYKEINEIESVMEAFRYVHVVFFKFFLSDNLMPQVMGYVRR